MPGCVVVEIAFAANQAGLFGGRAEAAAGELQLPMVVVALLGNLGRQVDGREGVAELLRLRALYTLMLCIALIGSRSSSGWPQTPI